MKRKITTLSVLIIFALVSFDMMAQGLVPELIYYKFDQTGTSVTNDASTPPAGTATGTIMGGQSQGGSAGLCGGALIGTGSSSNSDYVSTGWNTSLGTGAWTIAFWIDAMPSTTTLYYQFGDVGASSFRCFNNGVAGAGNFMLRGPVTDVECTGCATIGAPSMSAFVYDPTLGNIKAYHNGVLVNTVAQGALNITGSDFKVGGYSGSTGMASGQLMDEFRVYNIALDASEVFDTYAACLPLVMLPEDAGIVDFVNPVVPTCTFNDTVTVTLKNYGTDTLISATIDWMVNTTLQAPLLWTGSLAPQATQAVYLGTTPFVAGDDLFAWTTLPNGVVEDPAGSPNDTATILNLQTGLNGIKTVGGTAPDYADITAAVADLTAFGVCGPVIFDIRDGVYVGQINLPSIATMSPINTVTFRSENADSSLVSIQYGSTSAADNSIVNMNGVSNYHFENLTLQNTGTTYGTVVKMNGASMNSFIGCHMIGSTSSTTSTNTAVVYSNTGIDTNNVFMSNTFESGSYGVYWYGNGTTAPEHGNVFEDNHFLSNYFYGGRFYYNNGLIIKNNRFDGSSAYTGTRYAMYTYYAGGAPQITGNTVKGEISSGWRYGLYMSNGGGNNANHALVANNMLSVGFAGNTATSYGIYYAGSGYVDTYHNTALIVSGGASSRALYATTGGGIEIKNNILANYSSGYAIYVGNTFTVASSDNNVLYSPAGNVGYFGGNQQTMADWQNASSFDANSIDYNPNFYSFSDLHVCNDSIGNQGTPIPSIIMDVDGHPRNATTPDMGADEFSGISGSFLGPDQLVCAGDSIQLFAGSPTDTILWSTGDTTSSIWVSVAGPYTVSIVGACGAGSDAINVNASALNYAGYVSASDIVFCNGDSVLLYSTQAADTYTWTGGSSDDSLYVTAGGTYTLDIADGCGSGSESITVTMDDVPTSAYTYTTNFTSGIFTNTSVSGGNTTYVWDFGDGSTSTDMDPIHVYNTTGLFYATLTVTNDCGSMTFGDTVNIWVIGLEEIADFGTINVSPNPSNGMFNVELDLNDAMNLEMVVTNVMGQVVSTKSIDVASGAESTQIDLSTEAAGVYYLDILSGDKKLTNRMLIKK